jgi:hypothetical protein
MVWPNSEHYSGFMRNQERLVKTKPLGFVMGAVLVAMLIGSAGNAAGEDPGFFVPPPMVDNLAVLTPTAPLAPPVSVAPSAPTAPSAPLAPSAPVAPPVAVAPTAPAVASAPSAPTAPPVAQAPSLAAPAVIPDDYIYYPNYGVYYNSRQHLYLYLKGDVWVTRPAPEGVTAKALQTSPWVKMDFHDPPARHHAEMLKKYPWDWKPPTAEVAPGPAPKNLKP